jgi:hypothetical protein
MPEKIFVGFAATGKGEIIFDHVQMASAHLTSPVGNGDFLAPTNVLLSVETENFKTAIRRVEFFSNGEKIGAAEKVPYAMSWDALGGNHSIAARIIDISDFYFFTEPADIEIKLPPSRADFVRVDDKTKGDWKGVYGKTGFLIMNHKTNFPNSIQLFSINSKSHIWAERTPEKRGLARMDSTDRIAPSWFDNRQLAFKLTLADGMQHQLALYFLDWDEKERAAEIQVSDGTGRILNRQTVRQFSNGKYLVWLLRGEVTIRITALGFGNSVVSGLFFDPE